MSKPLTDKEIEEIRDWASAVLEDDLDHPIPMGDVEMLRGDAPKGAADCLRLLDRLEAADRVVRAAEKMELYLKAEYRGEASWDDLKRMYRLLKDSLSTYNQPTEPHEEGAR